MRIRSIRPEFWTSEDVAALDWTTRLVFIGLWSYVDDNGVGRDVERLIVTALFPLDEDLSETSLRVRGALKQLAERSLIVHYTVDGKPYLSIPTFSLYQKPNRPTPSRYPLPTCADTVTTEDSLSPHDALTEDSVSVVVDGVVDGVVGVEVTPPAPPAGGKPALAVVPDPAVKGSRRKPSRALPDDFDITPEMKAWSDGHGLLAVDVVKQTQRFKTWCLSKDQRYVDWTQAWRNWIDKAVDRGEIRKKGQGGTPLARDTRPWER